MIQRQSGRAAAAFLCAASATALTFGLASAAFAQDASAVGEVVVTASRIQAAGFTAPTPTTVLGTADLQRRAPTSVLEVINDVPAFRPSSTSQNTSSPTNGANSGAGGNLVDLRGLGTSRTLLLLNGRRTGGSQDLNQFPVILTQRIDVVTGGASAAYGSDAVAGVVNIVLDTKFEGLKGNAQYGQSKYGDNETWTGSLAYGAKFLNDRAHILLGGDYSTGKGAYTAEHPYEDQRPWVAQERYLQVVNPCPLKVAVSAACPTGGNGYSPFTYLRNVRFSTQTPGGIITAGPLKGITFEDNGTYRQFQYGVVMGNNMIGGDPAGAYNQVFALRPKSERYSLLAHLDYKVTDKVNAWLEYGNAQTKNEVPIVRPRDQGTITIQRGNPFIPAAIAAQMAPTALNLATLTMGRLNSDGGQPISAVKNMIYRFAGGLDGSFNAFGDEWTWDAHYQYGRLHGEFVTYGSRNTAAWNFAIDAVAGANGVPVCRAVLANNPVAAGCVPFNIFGPNAASQAARNYVFGTQSANRDTTQNNATFNLHGEPISTWAGPVAIALGGEYRKEQVNTTSDPLARIGGWDSGNIRPLTGQYHVTEGYAEAAVPLAKDMAFAKSLDLNGAIRYAKYSTAGGATTWKIGGTWKPIDEIMLRSTLSRDIRAPNNNELYNAGGVSRNNILQFKGPFAGSAVLTDFVTSGNVNLSPEKSKTWTAGVTLQPKFTRLRFSADYYKIRIKDQIGTLSAQDTVNLCRDGRQDMCGLLTFNSVGTVTSVLNAFVNNAQFQTRGLDLEASFVQPLDRLPGGFLSLPGTVSLRAIATRVFEYAKTDQAGYIDRVGQNHATFAGDLNIPKWLATYNIQYDLGRFSAAVQLKYIGPGVTEISSITGTATQRDGNKLSSQTTANLSASYVLLDSSGRRLQLYGTMLNAFNRGPPNNVYPISQPSYMYDSLGMEWRMGIRFQY